MNSDQQIGPVQEYDALRQEMLVSKRYVLERPLAIAALAVAGVQFFDKPQHVTVPLAVALLTVFNFWFTVNRLQSTGRIAAYMQLVLEPPTRYPWVGWEKSLRDYQIWLKRMPKSEVNAYVDARLHRAAVPDAHRYYPPIYYFHAALIGFAVIAALAQLRRGADTWTLLFSLCAVGVGGWSTWFFRMWRPRVLNESIERYRVIWEAALRTRLPKVFSAGETVEFRRYVDGYPPADGWRYTLHLNGTTAVLHRDGDGYDGKSYLVTIGPTDNLPPGDYRYLERVTNPATGEAHNARRRSR